MCRNWKGVYKISSWIVGWERQDCVCQYWWYCGFTAFFQQEYKDVDKSWITHFTNYSIRAVRHGADTYEKTRSKKTFEMVLLPITMFNDSKVNIEDQVPFVFWLGEFFENMQLVASAREKCFWIFWSLTNRISPCLILSRIKGKETMFFGRFRHCRIEQCLFCSD